MPIGDDDATCVSWVRGRMVLRGLHRTEETEEVRYKWGVLGTSSAALHVYSPTPTLS